MTIRTPQISPPVNEDVLTRAKGNPYFREVIATGPHAQVVVMSIPPAGEIGEEIHDDVDQVIVGVTGTGTAILAGERSPVAPGRLVLVPAGTRHNVVNESLVALKLYTVYTAPKHAPDAIHRTKAEADAEEGPD